MRAARIYGANDVRIDQVDEPACGRNQVKIAPAFVGICGTDLHEFSRPTFCPQPGSPHPLTGEVMPVTLGHEFSGVVVDVGEGVTDLTKGDHVAVQPTLCCSTCALCQAGAENVCDKGGFVGLSGGGGGLADFVVVARERVFRLPSNVSLEVGALVEPLAVAFHAVSASPVQAGDKVLVLGGGPIGLAVVQCLRARKAGLVIVSEVAPARQRFAKQFGADHVLDPREVDIPKRAEELCGGIQGPDVVFDCAGLPVTLKTACQAIRGRGTVVNVAIWEKEVPFNPNVLVFKEGHYTAVLGYQKPDFEQVLKSLAAGALHPHEMITKRIKLGDLVQEGFQTLINDKENHVKILVDLHA